MHRERTGFVAALLPRCVVVCTMVLVFAGVCAAQPKKDETPPPDPTMVCAMRVRNLEIGVMLYAQKHGGKLPPDLYSAMTAYAESGGKPVGELARSLSVSPAHAGLIAPPKEIDAPWVNEQSSYRYLGNADVVLDDVQEWGEIVIAHLRLEQGHQGEPTPENPTGETFTLAFLDGHVLTSTRAEAERLIAKSVATLDALRDGTPLPDDRQAAQNLATIIKAIHAYAKAHEGRLPPDLGATLAYVPRDSKATATGPQRAWLYLSPRTRTTRSVPDEPTPEWVNANTWYTYLGGADLRLEDIPETYSLALVHARLDDAFEVRDIEGKKFETVPVGMAGGGASVARKAYVQWIARESEKTFRAMRTGEPLPGWVHAMRDVHVIVDALQAYAKAHEGRLPATLGETMAYLPERIAGAKAAGTPAQVYLSPRAETMVTPPAPPGADAAWVTANASYVYITAPGLTVAQLRDVVNVITVYSPLDEVFPVVETYSDSEGVAVGVFGGAWLAPKAWVAEQAKALEAQLKTLAPAGP